MTPALAFHIHGETERSPHGGRERRHALHRPPPGVGGSPHHCALPGPRPPARGVGAAGLCPILRSLARPHSGVRLRSLRHSGRGQGQGRPGSPSAGRVGSTERQDRRALLPFSPGPGGLSCGASLSAKPGVSTLGLAFRRSPGAQPQLVLLRPGANGRSRLPGGRGEDRVGTGRVHPGESSGGWVAGPCPPGRRHGRSHRMDDLVDAQRGSDGPAPLPGRSPDPEGICGGGHFPVLYGPLRPGERLHSRSPGRPGGSGVLRGGGQDHPCRGSPHPTPLPGLLSPPESSGAQGPQGGGTPSSPQSAGHWGARPWHGGHGLPSGPPPGRRPPGPGL